MTLRSLRLVTGLVLMAFVTGHMINLMLGMHSLAAMDALSAQRSLAMSKTDVVQLCLGLAPPPLLLNHAVKVGVGFADGKTVLLNPAPAA